ncbi:hypothetical protein FB451DRAFT_1231009 [Mycena latifolia]|nr:hypothetical protein FB451DRAFT_1231009 [Mycena latifolia]
MFKFFKVLALNLAALSLVHSAPPTPQATLVSSNTDLGAMGALILLTHSSSLPLMEGIQVTGCWHPRSQYGRQNRVRHLPHHQRRDPDPALVLQN